VREDVQHDEGTDALIRPMREDVRYLEGASEA
jgi:hypothetical protein